jgi:hypothetical protein
VRTKQHHGWTNLLAVKKVLREFAEEIVRIIIRGLVWWTDRVGNFLIKLDLSPN